MELCWLTCVASELNGEELTRSGGVAALGRLLQRCLAVLPADAPPSAPAAGIATSCLRAFAGMAAFPNARAELAARRARSVAALRKTLCLVDLAWLRRVLPLSSSRAQSGGADIGQVPFLSLQKLLDC